MKIKVTGKYLRIIQNMKSFYSPEKENEIQSFSLQQLST